MNKYSPHVLFAKEGLSKYGVGVARGSLFQEIRPGAGFKTGDSVKEKLGTTTVDTAVERVLPFPVRKYALSPAARKRLCVIDAVVVAVDTFRL